jgi:hypothetical protein
MCIRRGVEQVRQVLSEEEALLFSFDLHSRAGWAVPDIAFRIRKALAPGVTLGRWGVMDLDEMIGLLICATNMLGDLLPQGRAAPPLLARAWHLIEVECPTAWLIEWIAELEEQRLTQSVVPGTGMWLQLEARLAGLWAERRRRAAAGDVLCQADVRMQ